MKKKPPLVSYDDTKIESWSERDRAYVGLWMKDTDEVIIEWKDEEVNEAIEDGFLDPRHLKESVFDYAVYLGFIREA